jgi:chemotaxis-related protein WspD
VDARELGRLLVVEDARDPTNGPVVFPVDAVDGVHRFARADFQAVPATLAQLSASHAEAVVAWKDTTVGLLDADKLLDTLNRSLT